MKSRKLFKVCALLMLAVMSCLLFSGCGGQSEQKKFVITYLPNESTDKNADARKGMAGDLSKVLGMEVTELVSNDYNAVIEAMRTGKADMAYFGPLSFCLAYERCADQKRVHKTGETIVCLPHKMVVTIEAGTENTVDAVVG